MELISIDGCKCTVKYDDIVYVRTQYSTYSRWDREYVGWNDFLADERQSPTRNKLEEIYTSMIRNDKIEILLK